MKQFSRDSSDKKLSMMIDLNKIKDEHEQERAQWLQEKDGLEKKLDEAIQINVKLFEKVKRLEQQLRERLD